jgi:DNA-binding CsgD family transcriptional regulator
MGQASRAQARIKQLCCLGLGGEAVMPALLRGLHALIPSYGNQFMWADENQQLSNLYGENPDTAQFAPLYVGEFYNRGECVIGGFTHAVRHERGVVDRDNALTVEKTAYYKSDLYNLLLRPLGYDGLLRITVRDGSKPLGLLGLFRGPKDPPFMAEDKRNLAALEPFIAHALTERSAAEMTLVDSGENGMIIADGDGKPVYFSSEGRRLLFLATQPQVIPGKTGPAILPAAVGRICRNLTAVFAGDEVAPAPVHRHANGWGGFTFRAYRLDAAETSSRLVGIAISRQEPLPLKLMRQMDKLPLTSRQAQVCILIASGLSYRAIAERLHISSHTVISHSRWIHTALGVGSRTELVNKVLAA